MEAADQEALVAGLLDAATSTRDLTPRERALLRYADVVTLDPTGVTALEIAKLRDVGLDDRSIHDACSIVAYFAFVNRVADGLGVQLEAPGGA